MHIIYPARDINASSIDDDDVTPSLPTFKTYVSNLMELNMLIKLVKIT